MASEKAKENRTLVATCEVCGAVRSVEVMQAVVVRRDGRRVLRPVCDDCRAAGRRPAP